MDKLWRPGDHPKPRRDFVFDKLQDPDELHPTRGAFYGLFHAVFHPTPRDHSRNECSLEYDDNKQPTTVH